MRELKYRVWDKEDESYLHITKNKEDGVVGISPDGEKALYLEDGEVIILEDVIIEQDTGIKDKNGVRIYAGDIVEFGLAGRGERGYVAYSGEYASFEVYSKRNFIIGCLFGHAGTVIGNIHKDKELLKGEK